MNTKECRTIRSEIEEASLSQALSPQATEHLRGCASCRTFQAEQSALQGLLANLDTVAAPPDFDFHLRARLAREKGRAPAGFNRPSLTLRPIAVAALILLMAAGGVVVKNWLASERKTSVAVSQGPTADSGKGSIESAKVVTPASTQDRATSEVAQNNSRVERENPNVALGTHSRHFVSNSTVRKNESATREFSITPATVVVSTPATDDHSAVLVPLNSRALKISVENGRGISRTISLPVVSFGSQRLVARESFAAPTAPKSAW